MMRALPALITLALSGLSGCTAMAPFMGGAGALDPRFQAARDVGAPSHSLLVQNSGATSLVVLLETRDGVSTWIGPFGEAVILDHGLIRGTRSLGEGLVAADVQASKSMILAGRSGQADRFHTYLTGGTKTVVRAFSCDIRPAGGRPVLRDLREIIARTVEEDCTGPSGDFVNTYWIAGGEIIQSSQWVGPVLGSITLTLRP